MGAKNSRKFEFKLGKTGMIVFILGVSLLVFCSFLFGVRIGKHIEVYPEKLAKGFPAMIKETLGFSSVAQEEHPSDTPAEGDKPVGQGGKDFDLTFYDTLTGKKGAAGPTDPRTGTEIKSSPEAAKQSALTDAKKTEIKPAAPMEKNAEMPVAAVPPPPATDKKAAPLPPAGDGSKPGISPEGGKCLVQVVSFPDKSKADGLSKRLINMGYNPKVIAADIPGKGKWHRVVVTGFKSRQDAQKASDHIAKKVGGVNCVILAE